MQRTFCPLCGKPSHGRPYCPHCGENQIASDVKHFETIVLDYSNWLEQLHGKIVDQISKNRSWHCGCMNLKLMQLDGLVRRTSNLLSLLRLELMMGNYEPGMAEEAKAALSELSRLAGQLDKPDARSLHLVRDGDIRELLERNASMILEINSLESALDSMNRRKVTMRLAYPAPNNAFDDSAFREGDHAPKRPAPEDERLKVGADAPVGIPRKKTDRILCTTPDDLGSPGFSIPMGAAQRTLPNMDLFFAQPECASQPVPEHSEQKSACEAILDAVEFRVAAPKTLTRGCSTLVKFMMYAADEFEKADRIVKYIADQVEQNVGGEVELERGTTLRICMQSRDVEIEDASHEMVWRGRFSSCDFKVTVPEDFSGRQIELTARVYRDLAVLADLKLILDAMGGSISQPAQRCALKSAFLSYSSSDRSRVMACMRGMLLARADMDIFIDVIKLRRGEHWEPRIYREIDRRDLFYLFWSRSAAQSKWVNKELEYALKTKGEAAIEPVPLELPEVCPPPTALRSRHFNDWMLLYELQCSCSTDK